MDCSLYKADVYLATAVPLVHSNRSVLLISELSSVPVILMQGTLLLNEWPSTSKLQNDPDEMLAPYSLSCTWLLYLPPETRPLSWPSQPGKKPSVTAVRQELSL